MATAGHNAAGSRYRFWRPAPRTAVDPDDPGPAARYYAFRNRPQQNTYIRAMPNAGSPARSRTTPRLPLRVAFPLALGIILSIGILAFSEIGSRELQQVVRPRPAATHQAEDLVREEAQVVVGHG